MTDLDYRNIYYGIILCAFVWGGMCSLFNSKYGNHYFFAGLLIIILSLFLGLRPYDIGADTQAYYRWFLYLKVANIDSLLEHFVFGGEPLFRSILYFSGKLSTFTTALLVICLCFNSLLYSFSLKITNYQHIGSALLLFLLMLSSFCIYNQQINVIRAGLGIMLLMTFSLFVLKGEKTWAVIYGFLAVMTHFSTSIFIIIILMIKCTNIPLRWYYIAYFVALALSYLNFSVLDLGFLQSMNFEKAVAYTTNIEESDYITGFRPTFAFYNTLFLFIFWRLRKYADPLPDFYLKYFIATSALFFLWFTIPFSDRIGMYSWIVIPPLLYIFINQRFVKNRLAYSYIVFAGYGIINYII